MFGYINIAAVCLALAQGQAAGPAKPVRLHVHQEGATTVIRVEGAAEATSSYTYDLQVHSGGNRSRQSGTARLEAGEPVTVATVRIAALSGVVAELSVKPRAGSGYTETYSSDHR